MPAQERESRKNYIGVLIDAIEQQRAAESTRKSDRLVKDYFRGLIVAVLNRDGDAR
jgi:hypothetical protein